MVYIDEMEEAKNESIWITSSPRRTQTLRTLKNLKHNKPTRGTFSFLFPSYLSNKLHSKKPAKNDLSASNAVYGTNL